MRRSVGFSPKRSQSSSTYIPDAGNPSSEKALCTDNLENSPIVRATQGYKWRYYRAGLDFWVVG